MNAPHTTTDARRRRMQRGVLGIALAGGLLAGGASFAFADGMPSPGDETTRSATATADGQGAQEAPVAQGASAAAQGENATTPAPPAGGPAAGPAAGGPRATHQPHLDGTVVTVDGDIVTIKDHDGFTRTIDATGVEQLQVKVGEHITAQGSVDSDGTTLNATTLRQAPTPPKPGEAPKPKQGGDAPTPPKPGDAPKPPKPADAGAPGAAAGEDGGAAAGGGSTQPASPSTSTPDGNG